jgi:hypothetical protein
LYGTIGEISRSGNYIYIDLIYAGSVMFGNENVTSSPFNNKYGALVSIYMTPAPLDLEDLTTKPFSSLSVYPNPAKNELYISSTENLNNETGQIINLEGKIIKTFPLSHHEPMKVSIEELDPGTYLLVYGTDVSKFHKL